MWSRLEWARLCSEQGESSLLVFDWLLLWLPIVGGASRKGVVKVMSCIVVKLHSLVVSAMEGVE